MGYNEITSGRDGFIQHSFGNVKTQQSPCCFRICQSDGIPALSNPSCNGRGANRSRALTISLIFIFSRKFACKYKKKIAPCLAFIDFLIYLPPNL